MTRLAHIGLRLVALACGGCFGARDFPMLAADLRPIDRAALADGGSSVSARQWAKRIHDQLQPLLPAWSNRALTTDDLLGEFNRPIEVYREFRVDGDSLDSLFGNFEGLAFTAQAAGAGTPGSWEGFREVRIPTEDGLELVGRISAPTGKDLGGSYVVLTHGVFSCLDSYYPLGDALRRCGHHVLAVELRGHGETDKLHPEYPITFGYSESLDLLAVSRWLRREHGAKRVGLLTYCLSGGAALLAAWVDGRTPEPSDADSPVFRALPKPTAQSAFDGILAVSATIDGVAVANSLERKRTFLESPIKATVQNRISQRIVDKGGKPSHRLWACMQVEFERSPLRKFYPDYQTLLNDLLRYLAFRAVDWIEGTRRMECVRCPLVLLQAADDPLTPAQDAVDMFARVRNPNCGVIIVRGGGHTGFASLSAPYYYSLIAAFFDPATAPRPVDVNSRSTASGR